MMPPKIFTMEVNQCHICAGIDGQLERLPGLIASLSLAPSAGLSHTYTRRLAVDSNVERSRALIHQRAVNGLAAILPSLLSRLRRNRAYVLADRIPSCAARRYLQLFNHFCLASGVVEHVICGLAHVCYTGWGWCNVYRLCGYLFALQRWYEVYAPARVSCQTLYPTRRRRLWLLSVSPQGWSCWYRRAL